MQRKTTVAMGLATFAITIFVLPVAGQVPPESTMTEPNAAVEALIEQGAFAEAEKLLQTTVEEHPGAATSAAAIQLEILRRTRLDFSLSANEVLQQIQQSIPDASIDDVHRWRDAGALQYRLVDGAPRFFRRSVSNLFRFNDEAKARRTGTAPDQKSFDLTTSIAELVTLAERTESTEGDELDPVQHTVEYAITVKPGHPRLQPGATIRVWLPFPQQYRQQRDVRLIRCEPPGGVIAPNGSPHRSIYLQHQLADPAEPPRFAVSFTFVTSAYCPRLDAKHVQSYDLRGNLYRQYTAERPPHIVFTPQVRRLAAKIVGSEQNPLEKARRIFRWVSQNIPWCAEMEYSIIPSLTSKGLTERRGDCGVQGMTWITLCRAAGVPARWQSGWQLFPEDWNMHDWAEFYVEPWGWLPADASYGVRKHSDERVRDFLCGHLDPYRLIVNLDYGRELVPPKTSFRSEPNDFQRGEVEIDGHNLYFDEWDWTFRVHSQRK